MYNHAPPGYICPFCLLIHGVEDSQTLLLPTDIVFQTAEATACMATRKWPKIPGHVLIVPNQHFENIYDLPVPVAVEIHSLSQRIALAMKAKYGCSGITLQQSNEPAGDQQIWHYHLHVIARDQSDDFHVSHREPFQPSERAEQARRLRSWLESQEGAIDE